MCLAMRSAVAGRNSSVAYSMPPVSSSPSSMLSTRSVCACALPSCRAPMRIRLPSARVCAHMALAQRARWHGHCASTIALHRDMRRLQGAGMLLDPHRPALHFEVGQAHCGIIRAIKGALQGHHRLEDGSVGGAPRHARGLDHTRERHIRMLDRVLDHALGTIQELRERGRACDATQAAIAHLATPVRLHLHALMVCCKPKALASLTTSCSKYHCMPRSCLPDPCGARLCSQSSR